ncbi:MAG TPA: hypothetical protein VHQ01_10805 [Pyrinomonadaceae bacterium]|nr:hypothetical protein [Pyrinomonadaceae bacterium]
MRRLLIISTITVLFAGIIFSQDEGRKGSVCTDESVSQISSRGIKVGSKLDEVLNFFAANSEEKEKIRRNFSGPSRKYLGYEFFSAQPRPDASATNTQFEGISSYVFTFWDERLSGFGVTYSKPKWEDSRQFAAKMAEFFALPVVEAWSQQNGRLSLNCGNYIIYAEVQGDGSSFTVSDSRLGKLLAERKVKYDKDQREADLKTFKP